MREIKFRAWNKMARVMHNWDEIGKVLHTRYFDEWIASGEMELMQYTGLHDKNGKEIYEGDILRCSFQEREIGVISWHEHGFWIEWPSKSLSLPNQDLREVIGNIYENPELLNGGETA